MPRKPKPLRSVTPRPATPPHVLAAPTVWQFPTRPRLGPARGFVAPSAAARAYGPPNGPPRAVTNPNANPTASAQAAEEWRTHGPPPKYYPPYLVQVHEHYEIFGSLTSKVPLELLMSPVIPKDDKWRRCEEWIMSLGGPDAVPEHGFIEVDLEEGGVQVPNQ